MAFRWKLLISYVLLTCLLVGGFYLFVEHVIRQDMIEESRTNLLGQTKLARLLVMNRQGNESPQKLAESIGLAVTARVTIIAADGMVIGDSSVGETHLAEMENHRERPEIQEALKNGSGTALRYSETLKTSMLYAAFANGDPARDGFVRLAMPLDYLTSTRAAMNRLVAVAAGVGLIFAFILSYLLSAITSRPLREMAAVASRIGLGETSLRIPRTSHDEVGKLGEVLNSMAERITAQMQSLSAEQERLDTILRGMGEGVMVASPDGVITLVNPAFHRLFGISGMVEGKRLIEISRHPDLQAAFTELDAGGMNELVREITIQPDDKTLLTNWTPLRRGESRQGVVAVFYDISERKKLENMRRDFVANVSHELRTPVSVIKGYAETLLDGVVDSDPKRSRRFVEIIHNHSERLATLLNDILTLSHLESREAVLDLQPLEIWSTLNKVCMLLNVTAREKQISILNEAGQPLPRVMADQGRLEQVLVNLLENALKYTPNHGTIRLSAVEEGNFLKISVADTGIGIPFKELSRIFERFYRVDGARTREQGGTGLGLSIVKHIIQLHRGEVSVVSEPGKGSVFSFTLLKAP